MPLLGDFARSKTHDAKINVPIAERNQFGKSGLATTEFFHPKHDPNRTSPCFENREYKAQCDLI